MWGDVTREIIDTVRYAGPDGIRARDVIFTMYDLGLPGSPQGIRGVLSRLARQGALEYRAGRYFEKRPSGMPFSFPD